MYFIVVRMHEFNPSGDILLKISPYYTSTMNSSKLLAFRAFSVPAIRKKTSDGTKPGMLWIIQMYVTPVGI